MSVAEADAAVARAAATVAATVAMAWTCAGSAKAVGVVAEVVEVVEEAGCAEAVAAKAGPGSAEAEGV